MEIKDKGVLQQYKIKRIPYNVIFDLSWNCFSFF